jgi:hypothetical protein
VALVEIAIGLLTTAGYLTRPVAAALPFVLVGAADQPAVDTLVLGRQRGSERVQRRGSIYAV